MHELAIADSIVQIASRHAAGRRVTKIQLKVGYLRQVVPSALTFSFELLAQGTPVEVARLEIQEVPARGECRKCSTQTQLETFPLQCHNCASLDLDLITGEELYVEYLELEDTLPLGEGQSEASPEPHEAPTNEGRSEARSALKAETEAAGEAAAC